MNKKQKIKQVLHSIGIPSHISGYNYMATAIFMLTEKKYSMTELCETAAKENNTDWKCAERCIRFAIAQIDKDKLDAFLGYEISTMKSRAVITAIAERITDVYYGGVNRESIGHRAIG